MTASTSLYRALLLFSLALPSLDLVRKYGGGDAALLIYPLYVLALVLLAEQLQQRLTTAVAERWCLALAVGALLTMLVAFLLIYPLANVHEPDRGSDADDAYNIGVRALLELRSPYTEPTYLGSRIHQLPGSLLLAMPFVLLGTSAWQNLFWMAVFSVVLVRCMGAVRGTLLLLLMVAASPIVMQQIVTGSDGVMTGLSTMLGLMAVLHTWTNDSASAAARWGSVLLLALALSCRISNVLGVIPPVLFVWQQRGIRPALLLAAVLGTLLAVLDLAFYVADPAMFSPLNAMDRARRFETVLPGSTWLMPLIGLVVTLLASWRWQRTAAPWTAPLLGLGLGQAVMVLMGMVLSSIVTDSFDTSYSYYACNFMLFPFCWLAWQRLAPQQLAWQAPTAPPALNGAR